MLTSIKLIETSEVVSITDQKLDQFCRTLSGICGNRFHHYNGDKPRFIFTIEQFNQEENKNLFLDVLSIDLSGLKVTINLVDKLEELCPKAECFFLNDTLFDNGSWINFNTIFKEKIVDLSIDNRVKVYMHNGDDFIRAKFKLYEFNKLQELKLKLMDRGFNPYHYNEDCKRLPKTLVYVYLEDILSNGCDLDCHCADKSVNNVKDNVHYSLVHEFNRTLMQCPSRKYYRLETGLCPTYSESMFADIGQHSGQSLKALNLTLTHKKFDLLVADNQLIRSKYAGQLQKMSSIELLALSIGKQFTVQLAVNLDDQDFIKRIKTLRLIGAEVAKSWEKILIHNYPAPILDITDSTLC